MKTLRHKLMRKSRRVLSLLSILFIVSMGIIPVFISYAISDEENATSKEKTEILWENDTEVGDFDFEEPDEVEPYKNYDWGDKTFGDSDSVINVDELRQENIIKEEVNLVEDPQKEVKLAVAAALTGVLGMSAIGSVKAKQKFQDQGGLKVSEKDQSKILDMINKASKKQYTFDEDGYLVFDDESPYNEKGSTTYSKLIDAVIDSDKDITVGIGSGYKTVDGEKSFKGDNQGVSVGDNRTDQVVVVSGLSSPLKDVEGNEIYGGAELTLAHELAHAVRGAYGLRNDDLTDDDVNEDEEAAAIGFENKVRYELGYGLRGDGSASSDINNDGIADGDGSYGEYTEDSDDWFDNIELNESASLTGSIFNFRRSKKKRKRDKERARRKRDKREKRKRIRKSKSRLDKIKRDIKKKNSSRSSSKKKKKKKSSSRNKRPSTSSSSSKSNKKDPRTSQLDNAVKNWDKKDKNYSSAVKLYEKAKKDLLSAKSNSDRSNALSRLDGLNKYFSKKDDKKAKPSSSTKKEEKKKEEKKNTQANSTTQGNTNTSNAEPKTDKSEVIEGFTPEYEKKESLVRATLETAYIEQQSDILAYGYLFGKMKENWNNAITYQQSKTFLLNATYYGQSLFMKMDNDVLQSMSYDKLTKAIDLYGYVNIGAGAIKKIGTKSLSYIVACAVGQVGENYIKSSTMKGLSNIFSPDSNGFVGYALGIDKPEVATKNQEVIRTKSELMPYGFVSYISSWTNEVEEYRNFLSNNMLVESDEDLHILDMALDKLDLVIELNRNPAQSKQKLEELVKKYK